MRFRHWKRYALLAITLAGVVACGSSFRQEAYDLLRERRYFEAEYYLARAVDIDPQDANAQLSLGVVYLHTYRDEQARRIFSDLVASNPDVTVEGDFEPGFRGEPVSRLASYYLTRLDGGSGGAEVRGEDLPAARSQAGAEDDLGVVSPPTPASRPAPERASSGDSRTGAGAGWGVHVFSVQDEAGAARVEKEMRQRFPTLFPSAPFLARRADLGPKGIFLRVIAGPYVSKDKAIAACVPLRKAYSFCQVLPY